MTAPCKDLEPRLVELWGRRDALAESQWEELFLLVQRCLGRVRLPEYDMLPAHSPEELILDYFVDNVLLRSMRASAATSALDHSGALIEYFRRYLIQRGRAEQRRPTGRPEGPAGAGAASGSDADAPAPVVTRLPDPASTALAAPGAPAPIAPEWLVRFRPGLDEVLRDVHLSPARVVQAAEALLRGHGAWADLAGDAWWIRLYLAEHHCPDDGTPLLTLSRRHDIRSYDYKARKLGITWMRGGFRSPADFAGTYLGRWVASLGLAIDAEHITAVSAVLEILCLVALSTVKEGA